MKTSGILWLAMLVLLAGCARNEPTAQVRDATPTFAPGPTIVVENRGGVCGETNRVVVQPWAGDDGVCLSSSCNTLVDQGGTLRVDEANRTIHVTSRFVFQRIPGAEEGMVECTADCGGAWELALEGEMLTAGPYTVLHGEMLLGQLDTAAPPGGPLASCVSLLYPAPTPEPPVGPTMTPNPPSDYVPPPTPDPRTPGPVPGTPYPGPIGPTIEPVPYPSPAP